VTDMEDGSYLVSYTPRRSGDYTIEVRGRGGIQNKQSTDVASPPSPIFHVSV